MKRIINGKRYDTEAAEWLASWSNMDDRRNWHYEDFTVWRTERGAYFIEFEGGPLSSRGRRQGQEYSGSVGIQPLTEDEAREHLERCGKDGAAALEKYFPVEDA